MRIRPAADRSPTSTEMCTEGPATFKQMCINPLMQMDPVGDAGSCFGRNSSYPQIFSTSAPGDCCLKMQESVGGSFAGECDAGPTPWTMSCLQYDNQGNTAEKIYDCGAMADAKTKCGACTDPRYVHSCPPPSSSPRLHLSPPTSL